MQNQGQKYIQKTNREIVDVLQVTEENRTSNENWPDWVNEAWDLPNGQPNSLFPSEFPDSDGTDKFKLMSSINNQLCSCILEWGDYLVKTSKGIVPFAKIKFEDQFKMVDIEDPALANAKSSMKPG